MKKPAKKKKSPATKASKPAAKRAAVKAKRAVAKKLASAAGKSSRARVAQPAASTDTGDKLTFNHAMIYVKDVQRGMDFYRDWLGFKLIEDFRYEGRPVYARLRAPGGDGTTDRHVLFLG